ncbi:MAG: hypothetical protein FD133_1698 [Erysipelotrichaceae bacterium]|nr:MAG: hypothetical protein FD179_1381 [Erysipelotrichaceae bacterium]TXT16724.1 MAG: hypothetical protein FD133_1698 [Erysipelotrichaceae bacterium]
MMTLKSEFSLRYKPLYLPVGAPRSFRVDP